jgi:hypothetical protein
MLQKETHRSETHRRQGPAGPESEAGRTTEKLLQKRTRCPWTCKRSSPLDCDSFPSKKKRKDAAKTGGRAFFPGDPAWIRARWTGLRGHPNGRRGRRRKAAAFHDRPRTEAPCYTLPDWVRWTRARGLISALQLAREGITWNYLAIKNVVNSSVGCVRSMAEVGGCEL